LSATSWCNGIAPASGPIASLARSRLNVHSNIDAALLDDVNLSSQIPGLCLFSGRELLYGCADQENVRKVIELRFGNVGLLEDITAKAQVPTLIGPIRISTVDRSVLFRA
jgi:hypothetical protein